MAYICKEGFFMNGNFLYPWKEFKGFKIKENYIVLIRRPIQRIILKKEGNIEEILKNYLKQL
jgi:hypothetical protein